MSRTPSSTTASHNRCAPPRSQYDQPRDFGMIFRRRSFGTIRRLLRRPGRLDSPRRLAAAPGNTHGVGAAIVSRLVAAGARVATTARSEGPHSDAFDLFVRADVGTSDGTHEVDRAVLERYGGLGILVHISIEVTIDRDQRRS